MATTTNTLKVIADTSQAERALTQLNNSVEKTNAVFGGLKNALAGLAIGSFITQAGQMANAISDMAKASGVTTQALLGFRDALTANGASAEGAINGISKFNRTIEEAANGSKSAQDAFAEIGISLQDLATLSEQDLLAATVQGLGQVDDASKRASLGFQLFGKSIVGADWKGVAADIGTLTERARASADAVDAAGQTAQSLQNTYQQLQVSVLSALKPFADFLNALLANKDAIQSFINTAVNVGTALAGFFVLGKVSSVLDGMIRSLSAASLASGGFIKGLSQTTGVLGSAGQGLRYLGQMFDLQGAATVKAYTGIGIARQVFTSFFSGITRLVPIISAITAGFMLLNEAIRYITGSSIVEWAESVAKSLGLISQTSKEAEAAAAATKKIAAEKEKQAQQNRQVADAMAKEKASLEGTLQAYRNNNNEMSKRFDLETSLIGKSEEAKQAAQMRFDAEAKYLQEMSKLEDQIKEKKASTSKSDQAMVPLLVAAQGELTSAYNEQLNSIDGMVAARTRSVNAQQLELFATNSLVASNKQLADIQQQITTALMPEYAKKLSELEYASRSAADAEIARLEQTRGAALSEVERQSIYAASAVKLDELKTKTLELMAVEQERSLMDFGMRQQIAAANELMKIQDDTAKLTMTEIEKKYYDIGAAARASAKAAIDEYQSRTGISLTLEQQQAYYDRALEKTNELKQAVRENYESSRTFATGWKQAMNSYIEDATNAASVAKNVFGKAFKGMEDLLVNFAKTGKFEWKNFVNMMLEELLRAQIQMIFAQMLGGVQQSMSPQNMMGGYGQGYGQPQGGGLTSLLGGIGSLFGGNQNMNQAPANWYAQTQTPNFYEPWKNTQTSGWDALTSGFGTVTSAISDFGSSVMDTFSSIGSGIADFFGGFFAAGGTLGAGKWGIAGENGPELITGPANVIPNPQFGGTTNVTYNIQAVDARSFKELVASDPGFIHGVAMMGARSTPRRI